MADTTLIARFEGDLGTLPNTVKKANSLVTGFGKDVAGASKEISKTTNNIGLGFKAIGGVIRSVTPFLDETTAGFVMFGTMAADSLKNAFEAVSKFSGWLKGGLVLGAAAAAAAVGYFAGRLLAGTAATEKALQSLERLNVRLRANVASLKAASDAWDTYEKSIERARIEFLLFGDAQEYNRSIAEASKKAAIDQALAQQKLADEYNAATARFAALEKKLSDAKMKLAQFNEEFRKWGATNPALEKSVQDLTQAEADLLAEQEARAIRLRSLSEDQQKLIADYLAAARAVKALGAAEQDRAKSKSFEIAIDMGPEFAEAVEWEKKFQSQTESLQSSLMDFVVGLKPSLEAVGLQFANLWTSFSQGFGDAVARAVVYGEDFGKAMKELGKQLLSTLVSFLIQTVLNALLYGVLETLIMGGLAAGRIALQASIAAAAAYASAIETMGIFGMAAGPGLAAAAAAGTVGAATKGFAIGRAGAAALGPMAISGVGGYAEGGLFTKPTLALIGEAGKEAVVPLDRLNEIMGERGMTEINIELNGRTIAQAVVPWIPGIVHSKGVKGI